MIPVHLKLKNFLSYRDEVSLDFTDIRIACLSGDNGSGKSALLDAITWAIWGKTRASNDREVVSIGTTEMEVTYRFLLGQREYRIFRRRSFARSGSGQQSLELYIRNPDDGDEGWQPITGDNVRETQEKIVRTLNMEYETFVNSAFILQGRADTFTQKPPGERKKILGDILNLQEYDELGKLARDDERGIRTRIDSLRGRMDVLDEQLADRPRLLDELDVTSGELNDVADRLDLALELARTLALQLSAFERMQELLIAANSRAEREGAALARLDAQMADATRERTGLLHLVTHADDIEWGASELTRWRGAAARMADTLRQVRQQVALQTEAERDLQQEEYRLTRERDSQVHARRNAEDRLRVIEREQAKLDQVRGAFTAAAADLERLPNVRAQIEDQRHERSMLQADSQSTTARGNEIKDNVARLKSGDADCPVCQQPISPEHRGHVEALWKSERDGLVERYRANQKRISEIDASLVTLADDQGQLEKLDRENAARAGTILQIESGLAERDSHQAAVIAATADIERLDQTLSSGAFALPARQRLTDAESALTVLAYDPEAHGQASEQERVLAPYEARLRDLEQARTRLEGIDAAITSIAGQLQERTAARDEALADVDTLRGQMTSDPNLKERALAAADDAERLERERNALSARHGGIERRLGELDRLDAEREQAEKETATLTLDHSALRELIEAFGRNGIQAMIVENILPELEDETNRLLDRMSSGQLRVAFRSQRQALSSDTMIETLDIIIRDEAGERPYALYSGGEAFRVNFAVRVAMSKLLARRAGANVDMLVIDEGFGTQDARGRDGLIEALRSIEQDFRTILVITHIGEVRDLFPTRIDVVKTDRGSQVTVT